ncbi:hypothetical protein GCM10023144_05520 [Pigmentiphaga soli]|uniref:Cobalamin biosynthesis protein CbiX n=1 Tax=Pigmentiphaga soli TaxID=1007095 RepID=A0ABP8GH98_9BURK
MNALTVSARALLLFAHGSRDPRWAEPLARLADAVRRRDPAVTVAQAFLELMPPTLPDAIDALAAAGHARVALLPVFWAGGGHVLRDLPALLEAARVRHPGLEVAVLPALSDLPGVLDAVAAAALEYRDPAACAGKA